jgi:2',3'-cyclic-nucleotide 2'-phosphodiesterase (5'-nucleotidase family)
MQSMLKHSAAAAGLVLSLAAAGLAHAATTTVKIVAFNDFHGNLNSPGTFSGAPSGGVDYLAGYIANLKSQNRTLSSSRRAMSLVRAPWYPRSTTTKERSRH